MVLNAEKRLDCSRRAPGARAMGMVVVAAVLGRARQDPGTCAHEAAGASPHAVFALRNCRCCINPFLGFDTTDCGSPEDLLRADSAKG